MWTSTWVDTETVLGSVTYRAQNMGRNHLSGNGAADFSFLTLGGFQKNASNPF